MRTIKYTSRFKRDYRREKSGRYGKKLDAVLLEVVEMLAADLLRKSSGFHNWLRTLESTKRLNHGFSDGC